MKILRIFYPDAGKDDYTHPNYRGYAKMAEHIQPLIEFLLGSGEKPKYMIDLSA